jgi:hypothetical protein
MANRGDLFEVVFAASIAARFKKRFEKEEKFLKTSQEIKLYQLPNITSDDVKKMLDSIVPNLNSGPASHSTRDVVGEGQITDYIRLRVSVPQAAASYMSKQMGTRYIEINDIISQSSSLCNTHSTLNSRARSLAINGKTDVIVVEAAGTKDQSGTKADVFVKVRSGGKTQAKYPDFSCKVPGGEQFHQVSGGSFDKFEELFSQLGVSISVQTHQNWIASMQKYLDEDVFQRKFASRGEITESKIPQNVKAAASLVYSNACSILESGLRDGSLKSKLVDYIIYGFSRGVDTELVKMTGSSSKITGFKTLLVNADFRQKMMSHDYRAELGAGPIIKIYANGITSPIMQFRYKWENPSSGTTNKVYKVYPRHYLEALDGMFAIK